MKFLFSFYLFILSFNLFSQSEKFTSAFQILNTKDSIFVFTNTRPVEINQNRIVIYDDNYMPSLDFSVNFQKNDKGLYIYKTDDVFVSFDSSLKIIFIKNKNIEFSIFRDAPKNTSIRK